MTGRRGWPIVLSDVKTNLGQLVRKARLNHIPPLTYEAAAEICGLQGPWNIQDIERGKSTDPQASTLAALSSGLRIPLEKLIVAIQKDKNGDSPPATQGGP